jgi:hypothetical protein
MYKVWEHHQEDATLCGCKKYGDNGCFEHLAQLPTIPGYRNTNLADIYALD